MVSRFLIVLGYVAVLIVVSSGSCKPSTENPDADADADSDVDADGDTDADTDGDADSDWV